MNRPSVLTSEISLDQVKSAGRWVGRLGQLAGIAVVVAVALGFRIDKPGERVTSLEKRVAALEESQLKTGQNVETLLRLQCLSMTRRDAQLAGACVQYPTRDESTRVGR